MRKQRTAQVYFVSDPHKVGYTYHEGYWVYKPERGKEERFETFSQGGNRSAESYAQRQLDLDEVDVVDIFSKTGTLRYSKCGLQYKRPDEILKIAREYVKRDRLRDNAVYDLWTTQAKLNEVQGDLEELQKVYRYVYDKYKDYETKAQKWDKLQEIL